MARAVAAGSYSGVFVVFCWSLLLLSGHCTFFDTCSRDADKDGQTLKLNKVANGYGQRSLAYKMLGGCRDKGVVYIPGFMGSMSEEKATFLNNFCNLHDVSFLRYDPSWLGESKKTSSLKQIKKIFSVWMDDAFEMFKLTTGPQIVVGHSIGGWIAIHLALKHPDRVAGLLLLGPVYNLHENCLNFTEGKKLMNKAVLLLGKARVEDIMKDAQQYQISVAPSSLTINCKVSILHGKDDVFPFHFSQTLLNALTSKDKTLNILASGDHHLQDEHTLNEIGATLLHMI
ncbi:palmitoyl-protein thioesterase ABHD10, mitochondrial isoform X2 [Procambarus clarkii]|uniref:palmitoyl-protein thioesterase ABHD10, mitochondrial isoform X2 n=1 Tax=Procambarus clarkii TaxID=6728 RepID=UPI001E67800B|nr:palmitoyl-protein thioesterase ABHD10, mitochondrial-like isoform X1 [Procambarus clarkii]